MVITSAPESTSIFLGSSTRPLRPVMLMPDWGSRLVTYTTLARCPWR